MAAPTTTDRRIDIGLKSIRLTAADLPEVEQERPDLSDGERASLSLDWDHQMGSYLRLLDGHYRAGTLTPKQRARYVDLLEQLKSVLPIIERLDFYRPPVSLEP